MGGDEFIIVGERTETGEIKQLMDKITLSALSYNMQSQLGWLILPSMGYSVYNQGDTMDSLLATADQEMYRNKQERKITHCN